MSTKNPFDDPNYVHRSQRDLTGQVKLICNELALDESVALEIDGLSHATAKVLLHRHYKGYIACAKADGVTWIKRIKEEEE